MSKVSVIVTVFNAEKYILEAIESLLKQDYNDFEIIIVNDGSTDKTLDILRAIEDPRIKLFNESRMGRTKALNFAVSKSCGSYVAILDADDIAFSERLSKSASYLDSNPNVGLIGSRYRVKIDADGNLIDDQDIGLVTDKEIKNSLSTRCTFFNSSVMYRREIFDKVNGYDEKMTMVEDWDFMIRISNHCDIVNLDDKLSYKRVHDTQYFETRNKGKTYKNLALINYRASNYLGFSVRNLLLATLYKFGAAYYALIYR